MKRFILFLLITCLFFAPVSYSAMPNWIVQEKQIQLDALIIAHKYLLERLQTIERMARELKAEIDRMTQPPEPIDKPKEVPKDD